MKKLFCLTIFVLYTFSMYAQVVDGLKRRALLNAVLLAPSNRQGAIVSSFYPNSCLEKAGLKKGDIIKSINGVSLNNEIIYGNMIRSLRAGVPAKLVVTRDHRNFTAEIIPDMYPLEKVEGLSISYDTVITSKGYRLRAIISKPAGKTARLPAILLVQWLSCSSVEQPPYNRVDGFVKAIHGLSQNGFVVMRVDKPGVGDSEGPPCSDYAYNEELKFHFEALRKLKSLPYVDTNNIILFGGSMGGAMAPLIAAANPGIKAIMIYGGYVKTWYEHMLEIERRIAGLSGKSFAEINELMKGWSEFYSLYLNEKLTPEQIITRRPHLAGLWEGQTPRHQYGRPAKFYMEANEQNLPKAWESINMKVLVMFGEYDWIMSREDHEMITEMVNRKRPGMATFMVCPKLNHDLTVSQSLQDAFNSGNTSTLFDESFVTRMIEWLQKEVIAQGR